MFFAFEMPLSATHKQDLDFAIIVPTDALVCSGAKPAVGRVLTTKLA